jgi:hypothetical protein
MSTSFWKFLRRRRKTVIELRNRRQMQNAIKKAYALRPFVRVRGWRWYEVKSASGTQTYTLHFYNESGRRLAECNCKGHERGFICYHIAAAACVHIGIARMRQAN